MTAQRIETASVVATSDSKNANTSETIRPRTWFQSVMDFFATPNVAKAYSIVNDVQNGYIPE